LLACTGSVVIQLYAGECTLSVDRALNLVNTWRTFTSVTFRQAIFNFRHLDIYTIRHLDNYTFIHLDNLGNFRQAIFWQHKQDLEFELGV